MQTSGHESSADNSGDDAEITTDIFVIEELKHSEATYHESNDSTGNNQPKSTVRKIQPGLQLTSTKRPHEHDPDEDEKRVRVKTNNTPQSPSTSDRLLTPPLAHFGGQTPDISRIMADVAAVTGEIVAYMEDTSSAISDLERKAVLSQLRDVLGMLVPCVTEVRDIGVLGIEIVGLAALVDPSLEYEGIFTIITSPYASSIPKRLELDYTHHFAIGDMFWDRSTEFAADQNLKPGIKAAPSPQGLVCAAWRLHIVTKVTPRCIWTTVCRLSGGKGLSRLDKDDIWMYLHLHSGKHGRLPRSMRAKHNDSLHASLTYIPDPDYDDKAIGAHTHFSAIDVVPHYPSEEMLPAGKLDKDSRDLFLGLKANANSPDGKLVAHPKGMDEAAVKRGLELVDPYPRSAMPLPKAERTGDRLFHQLRIHPSKGTTARDPVRDPANLLQKSRAFSSAYSTTTLNEDQTRSSVDHPRNQSVNKVSPFSVMPRTLFSPVSHPQQHAPAPAADAVRVGRRFGGEKAGTPATGQREAPSHANTTPKIASIANQPAMAQTLHQHDGVMTNAILNVTEQNQSLNLNHPVSSPSSSPERKRTDGDD
ncbi:uncharacterized protein J4E79_005299 [Alternaria viburni]|uniref:uncharacterized protein n=1 Tax=Alternaria viburni TaxID=566460 RepID=UPI0020C47F15|nr:uncharacterized protein J4E79_005299 [Alternaria viburni]KAI4660731.1 hypothetical protein J4E79_005299 [Alternaria viburni]